MNLPHYDYFTNDFKEYAFDSIGPNGKIRKIVRFQKLQDNPMIYNLAFGDLNPITGKVSDLTTSDNKDRDIVLATVANTVIDFSDHYGNHFIYAAGSTPARTRLYQIGLNRILDEIRTNFDIYGIVNEEIYPMQMNVNYEAFLIKRK